MRSPSAVLIVVTILLALCSSALAVPPAGDGTPPRHKPPVVPPPDTTPGLGRVKGIMVKSEESSSGRWVTIVATSFAGESSMKELKELGTLVPFRIARGDEGIDFPLGHTMSVTCHFSEGPTDTPGEGGPGAIVGIAAEPRFGESISASEKPDFKTMAVILREAISDEARLLTVDALITLPGKRSSKTLALALYDISAKTRLKAARELVKRQYKPAVEKLTALLTQDIESELMYQVDLAEVMAGAGHKIGFDFLLRHLEDEEPSVVLAVVRALAETGGADEAARLEALAAASKDEGIAAAAPAAVEKIEKRLEQQGGGNGDESE